MAQQSGVTIDLAMQQGALVRTYHFDDRSTLAGKPQRWEDIGADYRVGPHRGIDALRHLLTDAPDAELHSNLSGKQLDRAGALLFEILFGGQQTALQIVRTAHGNVGTAIPSPTYQGLRVRLCNGTGEVHRRLLGLPWRATMWEALPLIGRGWTFQVCRGIDRGPAVEYPADSPALIIAPAGLDSDQHVERLRNTFEHVARGMTDRSSQRFRVARTYADVKRALDEKRWHLLYYYGHGCVIDDQLVLDLGPTAEDQVLVRDLVPRLTANPLQAVFFNGCWTGALGSHSAGALLLPHVPFVLANATRAYSVPAQDFAQKWLEAWLLYQPDRTRPDPVEAAHLCPERTGTLLEWGVPTVHAHFSSWRVVHRQGPGMARVDQAELRLDRDDQRALMTKHIGDLAHHRTRRVEATIAYGRPGNGMDRISQQLLDYIEGKEADRYHISHYRVQWPELEGSRFDLPLKADLGHDPGARLEDVLRLCAPQPYGGPRIVWIEWGVLRDRTSYGDTIDAWLRFVRDTLAKACPDDIRLVAVAPIEIRDIYDGEFDGVATGLEELQEDGDYSTQRMNLTCLPALGNAKRKHIRDFLTEHDADRAMLEPLVDGIFRKTEGRYDETVAILRRGLNAGWGTLLTELDPQPTKKKRW